MTQRSFSTVFDCRVYSSVPLEAVTGTEVPYAYYSGTSMAAPYVSGVMALYLQVHGRNSAPASVRARFRNTATPVLASVSAKQRHALAPAIQQGGGLINAPAAILSTSTLEPSFISLNDSVRMGKGERTLKITNRGGARLTYKLTHVPALLVPGVSGNGSDRYDMLNQENFRPTYAVRYMTCTVRQTLEAEITDVGQLGYQIYTGYGYHFARAFGNHQVEGYTAPWKGLADIFRICESHVFESEGSLSCSL